MKSDHGADAKDDSGPRSRGDGPVLLSDATDPYTIVAGETGASPAQVRAAADLLADGATVPFIARYRKEATGSLDEVAIAAIRDRLAALANRR